MKVVLHNILDIYTSTMVHFLTNCKTQLSQPLENLVHTIIPAKNRGTQLIHAQHHRYKPKANVYHLIASHPLLPEPS
jgi:hypothetical protein